VILGTLAPYLNGSGGVTRWVPGLGLLTGAFISPHFDQLDDYGPNLKQKIMAKRPEGSLLVGIDEDTALCGDGNDWIVLGRRSVWIGEDLQRHDPGASVTQPLGLQLP
jgi:cyanophycinase-like exopeptidase